MQSDLGFVWFGVGCPQKFNKKKLYAHLSEEGESQGRTNQSEINQGACRQANGSLRMYLSKMLKSAC